MSSSPTNSAGAGAPAVEMANTLANSDSSRCLYVSLWMKQVSDMHKYRNFAFVAAPPLTTASSAAVPVPVRTDPATQRYLANRRVTYRCEEYVDEPTSTLRARIVALHIEPAPRDQWQGDATPIDDLTFQEFLERFLAERERSSHSAE